MKSRNVSRCSEVGSASKFISLESSGKAKAVPTRVRAVVLHRVQEGDELTQGKWTLRRLLRKTELRLIFVNQAVFNPIPRPSNSQADHICRRGL